MAREAAEEDRSGGEQAHSGTHIAGRETGLAGQDTAANGRKESELGESQEEYEKRIAGYAEAIRYFLDHPEAPLHPVTRAFIESIRDEVDGYQGGQQSRLN